jgi:uncharacterized protein YjaZ
MQTFSRRLVAALLVSVCASALTSCNRHEIDAVFYVVDGYRFTEAERELIRSIADSAARETRRALPGLPEELILRVNPGTRVIPETGENGDTAPPNIVYWTVDPHRSGGVAATARAQLRGSLVHELHHLVRYAAVPRRSLMDATISEGLATAFERDVTGTAVAWGMYPEDVHVWVAELMALPDDAPPDQWLSRHPDGRRWIGYKSGTYLVDRAMRSLHRSAAEFVTMPTAEIMRAALPEHAP